MRRNLVALDCDGVLSDFDGYATRMINEECGTSFQRSDWKEWWPTELSFGEHAPKAREIIDCIVREGSCYGMLDPIPGAKEQVARLREMYDVVILSSLHPRHYKLRQMWLREHIADAVGLVPCSSELKPDVCRALGVAALADDYQPTIVGCYHHGYCDTDPLGWLIDRQYNLGLPIPESQGARRGTLEQFVDHMLDSRP